MGCGASKTAAKYEDRASARAEERAAGRKVEHAWVRTQLSTAELLERVEAAKTADAEAALTDTQRKERAAAARLEAKKKEEEEAAAATTKAAIVKLRPKLEPVLMKQGLSFDDALPALELVDIKELEAAMSDPEAFLESLGSGAEEEQDAPTGGSSAEAEAEAAGAGSRE
jgi:secreted Zn-dependent insulinase-like peptidase